MPFPVHTLPQWLRNMVTSLAQSTQTDVAMPSMFALGLLSSTVARRVVVIDDNGRPDPLNLWVIVIAESGEGKSSNFNPLIEPIETALRLAISNNPCPELFESPLSNRPRIPNRYERIIAHYQAQSPEQPDSRILTRVTQAALRAAMWHGLDPNVARPDFIARDITPEALIEQMATQSMGILQASPEGGFASWIAASGQRAIGQLSNLNLCWEAGDLRVRRVSRESRVVERAVLTLVVAPQPTAFHEITRGQLGDLMRETGFLNRCLICLPESHSGRRTAPFGPVSANAQQEYRRHIWAMMILGSSARELPARLTLSPAASATHNKYYNAFEPRLRGDLRDVAPWATRIRQNVSRIAGLLHLANRIAEGPQILRDPIDERTMEQAIEIGDWLVPHGLQALSMSRARNSSQVPRSEDTILEFVQSIIECSEFQNRPFTVRDVQRRDQRRLTSADDVRIALDTLVARRFLASASVRNTVQYRHIDEPSGWSAGGRSGDSSG